VSSINPLGRLLNATSSVTTTAKRVNLRNCSGVLFLVANASAATAVTIQEANAATGGTAQNLSAITEYWTQAATGGVWTRVTQAAAATATTVANTGALLAVYIPQGALSDGFSYLTASHATGTIIYVLSDLDVQRFPSNIQDVTA
jgi:hypothetical protein